MPFLSASRDVPICLSDSAIERSVSLVAEYPALVGKEKDQAEVAQRVLARFPARMVF